MNCALGKWMARRYGQRWLHQPPRFGEHPTRCRSFSSGSLMSSRRRVPAFAIVSLRCNAPSGPDSPGRRYLGICAFGRRYPVAMIRSYVAHMAAAQVLYDKYDNLADPWMTVAGYFNSIRELAGTRRLVEDDIKARLRDADQRGLAKRRIRLIEELTSRKVWHGYSANFGAAGSCIRQSGRTSDVRQNEKRVSKPARRYPMTWSWQPT